MNVFSPVDSPSSAPGGTLWYECSIIEFIILNLHNHNCRINYVLVIWWLFRFHHTEWFKVSIYFLKILFMSALFELEAGFDLGPETEIESQTCKQMLSSWHVINSSCFPINIHSLPHCVQEYWGGVTLLEWMFEYLIFFFWCQKLV